MPKTPSKLGLEFTLESVEIPLRRRIRESAHTLTAQLIWPRVTIAKRTAEAEFRLKDGVCDMKAAPWNEKILFRETVDGRFALKVDMSVSLTRTQLRDWRRKTMGYILLAAGQAADDVGFAGELAEAPMKTTAKALQASQPAELYATGAIDLKMTDFLEIPPEGTTLKIPLISALDITKITRRFRDIPQIGTAVIRIQRCAEED